MKKIIFLLILTFMLGVNNANADYNASFKKLIDSSQAWLEAKEKTWPIPPLNDAEIQELTKNIQEKYAAGGHKITEAQAALILGIIGGTQAAKNSLAKAFARPQE